MSHAPYNAAGGNTWKKRKKANSGHSTKGRPGAARLSVPWKCPNPEHHILAPEAVLIGPSGKVLR